MHTRTETSDMERTQKRATRCSGEVEQGFRDSFLKSLIILSYREKEKEKMRYSNTSMDVKHRVVKSPLIQQRKAQQEPVAG